jgi:hypothetical protein
MEIALIGLMAQSDVVKPFDLPEEMPKPSVLGAYLEVDEGTRFSYQEIHDLYNTAAYPLKRGERVRRRRSTLTCGPS